MARASTRKNSGPKSGVPARSGEAKVPAKMASTMAKYAGKGFEGADREAFAIPFVIILQSGSPQCKRSDGAYIQGATEGCIFNTVTKQLVDGDEGIEVVPCAYRRSIIEWAPRGSDSSFIAEHLPENAPPSEREEGKNVTTEGNILADTRHHYVLVKSGDTYERAVIAMSSTQIKKSRQWMSVMNAQTFEHDGEMYPAPSFAYHYKLTTIPEQNDKGSWCGWKIERADPVEDERLLEMADAFRRSVIAGEAKAGYEESEKELGGDSPDY